MNGEPLPHFNGAPLRVIVPGWTATYWMKMLTSIEALDKPINTFWMNTAYRVPKGKFAVRRPLPHAGKRRIDADHRDGRQLAHHNIKDGQRIGIGKDVDVKGVAWDAGYGIRGVDVSSDGGRTWYAAELGQDLGRFSFRTWTYRFQPAKAGDYPVMARATNRQGGTQTAELIFNPAGYHNNVMQRIVLVAA